MTASTATFDDDLADLVQRVASHIDDSVVSEIRVAATEDSPHSVIVHTRRYQGRWWTRTVFEHLGEYRESRESAIAMACTVRARIFDVLKDCFQGRVVAGDDAYKAGVIKCTDSVFVFEEPCPEPGRVTSVLRERIVFQNRLVRDSPLYPWKETTRPPHIRTIAHSMNEYLYANDTVRCIIFSATPNDDHKLWFQVAVTQRDGMSNDSVVDLCPGVADEAAARAIRYYIFAALASPRDRLTWNGQCLEFHKPMPWRRVVEFLCPGNAAKCAAETRIARIDRTLYVAIAALLLITARELLQERLVNDA